MNQLPADSPLRNPALVVLRNRQHLIQELNQLDRSALDGQGNELWFMTAGGVYHTVHATVAKNRRVTVKLNGARSSRESILRVAGY